ncbi:MAG: crossover junction endodeoxyribonuclease RuvC [Candidatus Babeliales bacterium]
MKILGIDPGFRFAGYAVIHNNHSKQYLMDYGCLTLQTKNSLRTRLNAFYDFFNTKIDEHQITHLALETPFLGKNAQNFLKLGYLRGVLLLLSKQKNIELFELTPREIKLHITGYGAASKEQVALALKHLFPSLKALLPMKDDITDAIAITVCGMWKNKQSVLSYYSK